MAEFLSRNEKRTKYCGEFTSADIGSKVTAMGWVQRQRDLDRLTAAEAHEYIKQGHFAPGSMLPKVESCLQFVEAGGTALITSLEKAREALQGRTGTLITNA